MKLKCQEHNQNATHGRAMVQIGISPDVLQPISVQGFGAPCKEVPFEYPMLDFLKMYAFRKVMKVECAVNFLSCS